MYRRSRRKVAPAVLVKKVFARRPHVAQGTNLYNLIDK